MFDTCTAVLNWPVCSVPVGTQHPFMQEEDAAVAPLGVSAHYTAPRGRNLPGSTCHHTQEVKLQFFLAHQSYTLLQAAHECFFLFPINRVNLELQFFKMCFNCSTYYNAVVCSINDKTGERLVLGLWGFICQCPCLLKTIQKSCCLHKTLVFL